MADDLMDFGESTAEDKFLDDHDENQSPQCIPRLVQSPVIKNSILKQSTKDNLIQLYTPIQKPEKGKLKVRFGSDSLLQTPTVKSGHKKQIDSRGIQFKDITNSPTSEKPGIATEASTESIACANSIVNEILDNIGDKSASNTENNTANENTSPVHVTVEERTTTDHGSLGSENVENSTPNIVDKTKEEMPSPGASDECAMDISVCNDPPGANDSVNFNEDILKQAQLLLDSLMGVPTTPTDTALETAAINVETSGEEKSDEVVKQAVDHEVDGQVLGAGTVVATSDNVEEAMDVSGEAMEVDDEIVFNLPSTHHHEKTSDLNIDNQCGNQNMEEKIQMDEQPIEEKKEITKNDEEIKLQSTTPSTPQKLDSSTISVSKNEDNDDALSTSLNGFVHSEIPDVVTQNNDAREKEHVDEVHVKEIDSTEKEPKSQTLAVPENTSDQKVNTPGKTSPSAKTNTQAKVGTPAKIDTSATSTPAKADTSATTDTSATSTPAKADTSATSTPAKVDTSATSTPAKADTSATSTPAKADTSATSTPAKVDNPAHTYVSNSPAIPVSKGVYDLDSLDLDAMDPFKPKTQMINSPLTKNTPAKSNTPAKNIPDKSSPPVKTNSPAERETPTKTSIPEKTSPLAKNTQAESNTPAKMEIPAKSETPAKTETPAKIQTPAKTSPTPAKSNTEVDEDSSGDEFMSADEDMEVDVVKTPVKSANHVSDTVSNAEQKEEKQEESPERIPPKVGYNLDLDDLEAMDPFSTKKSIINSPDVGKSNQKPVSVVKNSPKLPKPQLQDKCEPESITTTESFEETAPVTESPVPSKAPKPELVLSPNAVVVDQVCQDKNAGDIFDEKLEDILDNVEMSTKTFDDMPVKGADTNFMACTEADIENLDPFKPKQQIVNSPDKIQSQENDIENRPQKIADDMKSQDSDTKFIKTESTSISNEEDCSSDVAEKHEDVSKTVSSPEDMSNIPVSEGVLDVKVKLEKDIAEEVHSGNQTTPVIEDKPTDLSNSPAIPMSKGVYNLDDLDLDAIDPFKPKTQMVNSPVTKNQAVKSEEIDPFKPKAQIMNSPVKSEEIDPFKPKTQIRNSPIKSEEIDTNNSSSNEGSSETVEAEVESGCDKNPENVLTQAKKSPVKEQTVPYEKTPVKEPTVAKENSSVKTQTVPKDKKPATDLNSADLFADLNPFKSKSKVASTPEKQESATVPEIDVDPFASKIKIGSSPVAGANDNPLVTKACVANSPMKDAQAMNNTEEIQPIQSEADSLGFGGNNDIFEVQGVTRRGQETNMSQMFGEVDESQFVSASQVFNDPAVWDMLENIGTDTSKNTESALSRMSLYVKFDPLVNEAPCNPRRVSIRFSQLEKVKEYGVDDTLLLLGTPPKKRRQSINQGSLSRVNTNRSAPPPAMSLMGNNTEPTNTEPAAVDLIFACSPKETRPEQNDGTRLTKTNKSDLAMCLLDECSTSEQDGTLFQELKYTEADLKNLGREMKLSIQGMYLNKEKEWCEKLKQADNEKAKLLQKLEASKTEIKKLNQVYLCLEQTVGEIIAQKDAKDKEIEEITKEKNQGLEDIQSIEHAFSILSTRYEKSKEIVQAYKKNDEILKKYAADCKEKMKETEEKYRTLQKTSEQKAKEDAQEIEKLKHQQETMQEKANAQVKLVQMKNESLEKKLEAKIEENKQLTDICDKLLQNS